MVYIFTESKNSKKRKLIQEATEEEAKAFCYKKNLEDTDLWYDYSEKAIK